MQQHLLRRRHTGRARTGTLRLLAVLSSLLLAAPVYAADPGPDGQWYTQFLHLDQAHRITRGAGVIVAVIDTGVDATHPDLAGTVLPGIDLSCGVPTGNGHIDTHGHGTAMASLITGHGTIRGVAPDAKVLPIRSTTGTLGVVDTPAPSDGQSNTAPPSSSSPPAHESATWPNK